MSVASVIQTNFTSGEVSPLMKGRTDVNKYANGAEVIQNFVVRPQGGITRRMGTLFKFVANDSTNPQRLREFIVTNATPYTLEFGVGYLRFIKNGVLLGAPLVLTTPYVNASDLNKLSFAQSANEMFIACDGYQPMVLMHFSDTNWVLSPYDPVDGPYMSTDQSDTELVVSNYSDVGTLTGGSSTQFNSTFSGWTVTGPCTGPSTTGQNAITDYVVSVVNGGGSVNVFGTMSNNTSGVLTGTLYFPNGMTCSITGGSSGISGGSSAFTVNLWATVNSSEGSIGAFFEVLCVGSIGGANYRGSLEGSQLVIGFGVRRGEVSISSPFFATVAANTALVYAEYWNQGAWQLASLDGPVYGTGAQVVVHYIPNTLSGIDPHSKLSYSGSTLTSSLSGVFTWTNVGQYVRATSGVWYLITVFLTDSTVTATAITLLSVSFPTNTLSELNRFTTITITANKAIFVSSDAGRDIRLNFASLQVWAKLLSFTSSTVVFAQIDTSTSPSPIDPVNGKLPTIKNKPTTTQTATPTPTYIYDKSTGEYKLTQLAPVKSAAIKPVPLDPVNYAAFYNNGVADNFRLGAWSGTTGYPATVWFHQNRLWFGRTPTQPNTFWGSKTDDYFDMAPTEAGSVVMDANAITFTIASAKADSINWATSGQVMLLGTDGGEYRVQPDSVNQALTPADCDCTQQTPYGSRQNIEAIRIGIANLFVERSGIRVREMVYNFQFDAFEAHDLTTVSEHILRRGGYAIRTAYQMVPYSLYWVLLNDGTLASLTYDHDQQVIAWHQHYLGANGTAAVVESICVIPSSDGTYDQLWLSVKRTLNGSVTRTIEVMAQDFSPLPTSQDSMSAASAIHLDCVTTATGPASSMTVNAAFNGESVAVWADGLFKGMFVVAAGAINFSSFSYNTVAVGYQYTSRMRILPIEGGGQLGSSQGDLKRIHWLVLRLLNTLHFKFGSSSSKLFNPNFNDLSNNKKGTLITDGTGAKIPQYLLTTDFRIDLDNDTTYEGQYEISESGPYPLTILATMAKLRTNE